MLLLVRSVRSDSLVASTLLFNVSFALPASRLLLLEQLYYLIAVLVPLEDTMRMELEEFVQPALEGNSIRTKASL